MDVVITLSAKACWCLRTSSTLPSPEHKIRKAAWLVVCPNNAHLDQSLVQFVQTLVHF